MKDIPTTTARDWSAKEESHPEAEEYPTRVGARQDSKQECLQQK
jgi:hypothetical protein